MNKEFIRLIELLAQIMEFTKRSKFDSIRYISIINRGINPFSKEEIEFSGVSYSEWIHLLKCIN